MYRFFCKPSEDFHLWCARTEAALESNRALSMIQEDFLAEEGELSQAEKQNVAVARSVLNQGRGDRPLRLCFSARKNPYAMWKRLQNRYAASNTAKRVQLPARLAHMVYNGESMQDYIDSFESIFNRLEAMYSPIAEDLQVALFLSSFGEKKKSTFGHVIASLQTKKEGVNWEQATSALLQEYEEHVMWAGSRRQTKPITIGQALTAGNRLKGRIWEDRPSRSEGQTER